MAGISGLSSGPNWSVLFGTSDKQSSSTDYSSIFNLDLGDMASVRNGSYGKLLKNYYAQDKAARKISVGDSAGKLTNIKKDADELVKKADYLSNSSLYKTKTVVNDKGVSKEEFADPDKLSGAVKDFVKAYNSAIDSAGGSETKNVLRTGGWMAGMTKKNERLLSEVGIKVGDDDKLSFDETKFRNANTTTVKDLLSGFDSFAFAVGTKASSISRATQNAGALYTASGSYSTEAGRFMKDSIARISGNTAEEEKQADKAEKIIIREE